LHGCLKTGREYDEAIASKSGRARFDKLVPGVSDRTGHCRRATPASD
jgi:hypothetical protein